jgi:hypothetical protein
MEINLSYCPVSTYKTIKNTECILNLLCQVVITRRHKHPLPFAVTKSVIYFVINNVSTPSHVDAPLQPEAIIGRIKV